MSTWQVRRLRLGGWLVHVPDPTEPDNALAAQNICEVGDEAIARLVAAAPELLAALCDCADRLSGVSGVPDPIKRARAAIALATGEES